VVGKLWSHRGHFESTLVLYPFRLSRVGRVSEPAFRRNEFHTLYFASSSVILRNFFWTVSYSFLFQVSILKSRHAFLHFIVCLLVTEETEDLAIASSSVAALHGDMLTVEEATVPSKSSNESSVIMGSWVVEMADRNLSST